MNRVCSNASLIIPGLRPRIKTGAQLLDAYVVSHILHEEVGTFTHSILAIYSTVDRFIIWHIAAQNYEYFHKTIVF